jgi:hypothetical protein
MLNNVKEVKPQSAFHASGRLRGRVTSISVANKYYVRSCSRLSKNSISTLVRIEECTKTPYTFRAFCDSLAFYQVTNSQHQ